MNGTFSHRTVMLNSLSNVARYFITALITLVLTPFVVKTLGNSYYGVWIVILSFIGYANTLEFGIQRAVVKLVAEKRAAGDIPAMNRLLSTALAFFALAGALVLVTFVLLVPHAITGVISNSGDLHVPRSLFVVVGLDIVFIFLNYVLSGILYGYQMYHRMNVISVLALSVNTCLIFLFLEDGKLLSLACIKLITDGLTFLATLLLCRKVTPELVFDIGGVSVSTLRELFGFGGRLFVSSSAARLANETQPLIISHAMSAAYTAFFGIPKRLLQYSREIHWALARGFMPTFSDVNRREGRLLVREIYFRYSRYILLAMAPVLVLVFVYGPEFIGLWIGPEYESEGRFALFFLAGDYAIELFQPLLWSLFIGVGQLSVLVRVSVMGSLATVALSFALVRPLGITGVAFSTFLCSGLEQGVYTWSLCRFFRVNFIDLVREVHLRPLVCAFLFLLSSLGMAHLLGEDSYAAQVAGVILASPVYLVAAYSLGLSRNEKAWMRRRLPWLGRTRP